MNLMRRSARVRTRSDALRQLQQSQPGVQPTQKRALSKTTASRPLKRTKSATKRQGGGVVGPKFIGAHMSMAGGFDKAVERAVLVGAKAFALDTRSKRRWDAKPIDPAAADRFKTACKQHGFSPAQILPHGSYLMNCGSPSEETLEKSRNVLVEELQRCEQLGIVYYNFHPGSTVGKIERTECLDRIAESINLAHKQTSTAVAVVENMAGQGNVVGGRFEDLAHIINGVQDKSRIGVCLDTCHMFAAGYDIRTKDAYEATMSEFDRVVGFRYLRGLHLNDSKTELGSKKDRHESIGKGHIGTDAFRFIMADPRFEGLPMILETPVPDGKDAWVDAYKDEIQLLQSL